ncbi:MULTISPECIES: TolC family protein [unclassified Azospirillum]|uniref:TolC family protein n=1 Tax=unclassified Azospirillum TaxID=2630922 RepID=UPI000B6FC7CC|nr:MULTISPECIES: TolC family protein [unclassified Azospirillum]SNS75348.1 Outer membrane protein TolC [Azospirillum sp. RU38E]SNS92507.1 Outer membrane protein TolC [Azospirillum sp. RU37A]
MGTRVRGFKGALLASALHMLVSGPALADDAVIAPERAKRPAPVAATIRPAEEALAPAVSEGEIRLSTALLVSLAVSQNARSISSAVAAEVAGALSDAERALYEPTLSVEYRYNRDYTEYDALDEVIRATKLFDQRAHNGSLGVEGLVPYGGRYEVKYKLVGTRSDNVVKARKEDTEYKATFEITLRQPLLRNFGSNATRSRLMIAEKDQDVAYEQYRLKLLEVAGDAVDSYWSLYGAQETVSLLRGSVAKAEKLVSMTEQMADAGRAPRISIDEARAGLTARQVRLAQAEKTLADAETRVWTLLNLQRHGKLGDLAVRASERPSRSAADAVVWDASVARARENWPEYAIAKLQIERETIRAEYAENQARPDLDLVASYSTPRITDSPLLSSRDALHADYNSWFVGVTYKMPLLGNGRGSNEAKAASLGRRRAVTDSEATDVAVTNAIRSRIDAVRSNQKQLAENERAATLRQGLLSAALDQFEKGRISLKEVLDREEELLESQRQNLVAHVELDRAFAALDMAEGMLLQRYGINAVSMPEKRGR